MVGDSNILVQVVELLESSGKKFHIEDISTEDTSYERFTILKINQFLNPQDFFLYIHTKGITRSGSEKQCSEDWRHFMEYYLIYKYEMCIGKLIQGYHTVGANLQYEPSPHYSGNFWWCKAEYFLSLDTKNMERSFYGSTYLACEMFLLCGMKDDYTKAFVVQNSVRHGIMKKK